MGALGGNKALRIAQHDGKQMGCNFSRNIWKVKFILYAELIIV